MKKTALILVMLIPLTSNAAYLDIGLSSGFYSCLETPQGCSSNPLGFVSLGQNLGYGFTVSIDHYSSLLEKDRGFSAVTLKYRIGKD